MKYTIEKYKWENKTADQMSLDELKQALVEAKKLTTISDLGYWSKVQMIEDLEKRINDKTSN